MDSAVKEIVQRAHSKNDEIRKTKRLEALSDKRNLSSRDFRQDISEKDAKTLSNLCKSGKLSTDQFRDLSLASFSGPFFVRAEKSGLNFQLHLSYWRAPVLPTFKHCSPMQLGPNKISTETRKILKTK